MTEELTTAVEQQNNLWLGVKSAQSAKPRSTDGPRQYALIPALLLGLVGKNCKMVPHFWLLSLPGLLPKTWPISAFEEGFCGWFAVVPGG